MANILVVDDSGTIRTILKKILEEKGHAITEAIDGVDALAKLNNNFNIILSDINMPNMDGMTFSQKVKEGNFKHIPIVVISTENSADMKAKAKEIGVTAWVTKPPNAATLLDVVGKILSLKKTA